METSEIDDQNASIPLQEVHGDEKWRIIESKCEINVEKPAPLFPSKRLLITVLLFLSNANQLWMRCNVNVAIIEMTSSKTILIDGNRNVTQLAEFQWDTKTVGLVLSIVHYGYLLSFLSGFVISKVGGSTGMAVSMMISGILTFLQPLALSCSFILFVACRFLIGVGEGFAYTGLIEVSSRWMPKSERGTLLACSLNGFYVGLAAIYPFCAFIVSIWGWPMVFYITGIISWLFSLTCLIVIRNQPSEDKWISKKELAFILRGTNTPATKKVTTHPVELVLTPLPVFVLYLANFFCGWIINTAISCLPLYVKDSTGKSTKEVALISSLPNYLCILIAASSGPMVDYWKNRSNITQTRMHKIVIGVGFTVQFMLFLAQTLFGDLITTIIIFIVIRLFEPFVLLSLAMISVTLAPNHTGLVAGYTSFCYSIGPIAAQTVASFMTIHHTINEWNNYFLTTAGIASLGTILFTLYGSSEPQPWSVSPNFLKQPNLSYKNDAAETLSKDFE